MHKGKWTFFHYMVCVFVLLLASCSSTKELVVLLPGEDGETGAVVIEDGGRTVVLDAPLAAAKIDARGHVKKGVVTEAEVEQTFAPALAAQPPKPVHFILYFEPGSTEATAESQPKLQALFEEVAKREAVEVQITGHTDRVGAVTDNDRLALQRAQAVKSMLMQRGMQASFIRAVGRGEREPLIPTPDEQEEPRNRRVEVLVR
jgi:outer membrane protein OmpA-like peptidoglycan-associated protein